MNPHFVKKGAQANLKILGADIIKAFEHDERAFGPAFYNDLVAKMILFRMSDSAILKSDWYKVEKGLKAEIVTYSIALLRYNLIAKDSDINLSLIYRNQSASESLLNTIVLAAQVVRNNITNFEFTGGITNPSEFTKSEKGWRKIQTIDIDLSKLQKSDTLSAEGITDANTEKKEINKASMTLSGLEYVLSVPSQEWDYIAQYNSRTYPDEHKNVGIPRKCIDLHVSGKMLTDKQLNIAKEIRVSAYKEGFDYVP